MYRSGKVFTHAQGLSCCFRQWRATHSHCQFLHGYALEVELEFASTSLDARGWVVDFGDFGELKEWLKNTFDHKTVVAADDPKLATFEALEREGLVQLTVLPDVGCEAFAKRVFEVAEEWLAAYCERTGVSHAPTVSSATVREHGANFARYTR